ncbi:MAG TPA: hypothetical protein VF266_07085 [Thermoanaerobaculia bacterium]
MKFIWSLVALLLATPMSAAELFPVANTRYGAAQGEAFQCADPGFRATKVERVGAESPAQSNQAAVRPGKVRAVR